jgi:hypothetical protein
LPNDIGIAGQGARRESAIARAKTLDQCAGRCAQAHGDLRDRIKHTLRVDGGRRDDTQDVG